MNSLVNSLVNSFLRVMNGMYSLGRYTPIFLKKYTIKSSNIDNHIDLHTCVCRQTIHSIHQQKETIHQSLHKTIHQVYMFFQFLGIYGGCRIEKTY